MGPRAGGAPLTASAATEPNALEPSARWGRRPPRMGNDPNGRGASRCHAREALPSASVSAHRGRAGRRQDKCHSPALGQMSQSHEGAKALERWPVTRASLPVPSDPGLRSRTAADCRSPSPRDPASDPQGSVCGQGQASGFPRTPVRVPPSLPPSPLAFLYFVLCLDSSSLYCIRKLSLGREPG